MRITAPLLVAAAEAASEVIDPGGSATLAEDQYPQSAGDFLGGDLPAFPEMVKVGIRAEPHHQRALEAKISHDVPNTC